MRRDGAQRSVKLGVSEEASVRAYSLGQTTGATWRFMLFDSLHTSICVASSASSVAWNGCPERFFKLSPAALCICENERDRPSYACTIECSMPRRRSCCESRSHLLRRLGIEIMRTSLKTWWKRHSYGRGGHPGGTRTGAFSSNTSSDGQIHRTVYVLLSITCAGAGAAAGTGQTDADAGTGQADAEAGMGQADAGAGTGHAGVLAQAAHYEHTTGVLPGVWLAQVTADAAAV